MNFLIAFRDQMNYLLNLDLDGANIPFKITKDYEHHLNMHIGFW